MASSRSRLLRGLPVLVGVGGATWAADVSGLTMQDCMSCPNLFQFRWWKAERKPKPMLD